MATEPLGGSPSPVTTPNHETPAHADLASVWVRRWTEHGGSIIFDMDSGQAQIGMSEPSISAMASRNFNGEWRDGFHTGSWRELETLLREVEGLRGAVVDHVCRHGHEGVGGWRFVAGKPASIEA